MSHQAIFNRLTRGFVYMSWKLHVCLHVLETPRGTLMFTFAIARSVWMDLHPPCVRAHTRTHVPVDDVPLGPVDHLRGAVARAPVDAHRLGLLSLPRRIVGRHPAEPRVVHAVRSGQVPTDVRLLVYESAAHGPGQVSVVVQVPWNTQSLNYTTGTVKHTVS